jgi:hypothetical protein
MTRNLMTTTMAETTSDESVTPGRPGRLRGFKLHRLDVIVLTVTRRRCHDTRRAA